MLQFKIVTVNVGIIGNQITPGGDRGQGGRAADTGRTVSIVFGIPAYMVVIELNIIVFM